MRRSMLSLVLLTAPASADPAPKLLASFRQPLPRGEPPTATQLAATATPRDEVASRRSLDPAAAARVFGARVADPGEPPSSVIGRPTTWVDAPKTEKKRWRPKWMLWPLKSSGTGARGIVLKVRY